MEISVAVATRPDVPLEEALRIAALADRLGYGELWVGEGWVWDSFALATAIGVAAERIAITVGLVGDADAIRARLDAYAVALDEVVLVPATAGDPAGERTLTALAPSDAR
jgi:alkanesulfonate monooxygenase SsuD/methylene tetrahydromethanopterin reductase-like flavin-dependent oxidoreductase (luciferase family)